MPESQDFFGGLRRLCGCQRGFHRSRVAIDLRQRALRAFRVLLPLRRSVVRIHVVCVVLAECQHELHIALGKGIHRVVLRRVYRDHHGQAGGQRIRTLH